MNLLIANRGEIAIRIARAAAEFGMQTISIYSEDDATSLHRQKSDKAIPLRGVGASAYLDIEQIIEAAQRVGCDAIHPGYGFLSENAEFAHRCAENGITFVGPRPEILSLLGDKVAARTLAKRCNVPVLSGTFEPTSLDEAKSFLQTLGSAGAMMIKAVAGGGGRGMRAVYQMNELEEAYLRCQSEAKVAFGHGELYVEQLVSKARHIEVQIIGDGTGGVSHLWERECTIQRRHQKIVEIAPSPGLPPELRESIIGASVRLAQEIQYDSLGTFEFLVDITDKQEPYSFVFIEANPRLQVEHTVTEEVTGIDLVKSQLQLASGASLTELGLEQSAIPQPRGFAIQARINMETMQPDGTVKPSGGTLTTFELPSGPGLRVDTFGYVGYTTSPNFDSLLAKLIGYSSSPNFSEAVQRTYRALCECQIEGVSTNIPLLQNLLKHPGFVENQPYTRFVEEHIEELTTDGDSSHQRLFFEQTSTQVAVEEATLAGAKIDSNDPLAVLDYGKSRENQAASPMTLSDPTSIEGGIVVKAPLQGTIVSVDVNEGDLVYEGQQILVIEAMKMENVMTADAGGRVQQVMVAMGDTILENHPLLLLEAISVETQRLTQDTEIDLDHIRPDLAEVHQRHAMGLDEARPDAVERRRKWGLRTARENIADLCDSGTFVEYGPLVIAAQRQRRSVAELIERTPADGMVGGIGSVNGELFDESQSQCFVISYDYTVLAGTQGHQNHRKKDRLFELAERQQLPVICFAEGGGGRPGDTDGLGVSGLDCLAFYYFGKLSGLVPLVGITNGRCFAGNALLLGCCDVTIATKDSNVGMGGPAMIEGGGLGIFRPEEIGPMAEQVPNGVVDILVENEAEAVQAAKKYLSYFQGTLSEWSNADQRLLRSVIPENRLRIYDVRSVIETLADTDSVLELRKEFALGMVTSFIRIEGRPVGLIANNPTHLAGAITSDGADKAARFMQLCDAFEIPLLFLCDTPGIMVGPEAEKSGLVRHASRLFVIGANLRVPFFTIILRKAYGLGAQAMAGGSFKAPLFTISWPTGEFGGMGLEGAVKLGYRRELAVIEDSEERMALYEQMVTKMYEHGKALNVASHFEIDDVIDPMDSRQWVMSALRSVSSRIPPVGKNRPCVDTW